MSLNLTSLFFRSFSQMISKCVWLFFFFILSREEAKAKKTETHGKINENPSPNNVKCFTFIHSIRWRDLLRMYFACSWRWILCSWNNAISYFLCAAAVLVVVIIASSLNVNSFLSLVFLWSIFSSASHFSFHRINKNVWLFFFLSLVRSLSSIYLLGKLVWLRFFSLFFDSHGF